MTLIMWKPKKTLVTRTNQVPRSHLYSLTQPNNCLTWNPTHAKTTNTYVIKWR